MSQSPFPDPQLVTAALDRARSWNEAERNLSLLGLHLRGQIFHSGGVYVTAREDRQRSVDRFWSGGANSLAAKYGETYDDHSRRLFAAYSKITGLSYEELVRSERY